MTQMQPDAPENSLVVNEGVNAGSAEEQRDEGGSTGDALAGGHPEDADQGVDYGDESLQAGELAGAADPARPDLDDSGQDNGLMGA